MSMLFSADSVNKLGTRREAVVIVQNVQAVQIRKISFKPFNRSAPFKTLNEVANKVPGIPEVLRMLRAV